MTNQQEKNELISWVTALQDQHLIKQLLEIKKGQNEDWWKQLTQDEKSEILLGLEQVERGETVPHEVVKSRFQKWL